MTEPTKSGLSSGKAADQPTISSEEIGNIAEITSAGTPLMDAYVQIRQAVQGIQVKSSGRARS